MKNLSPKTYIGNKDIVKASISIDKEDFEMSVDVTHNDNMFAPFYNPDDRHNNMVYEKSVKEYNRQMDALVKKGVLICESD